MIEKIEFKRNYEESLDRRSVQLSKDAKERIGDYFYLLHRENEKTNLTGYNEVNDFVDFHLLDVLNLIEALNPVENGIVVDVGSGAGIPGLLMKMLRTDLDVTLVESNKKKTGFLHSIRTELSLNKLKILDLRAEEAASDVRYREKADIATARALGPFSIALELTIGFVKPQGSIVLPRSTDEDVQKEIQRCSIELPCRYVESIEYTLPRRNKTFQTVIIKKNDNLSSKYPRKPGQIRKRPL